MTDFTASSGIKFTGVSDKGGTSYRLTGAASPRDICIWAKEMEALREFFEHERDKELGRWRWPEHPEYVVYPKEPTVTDPDADFRVVHEVTGRSKDVELAILRQCGANSRFGEAALAYADAHPAPKPWQDAKDGEVWRITSKAASAPRLATVHGGHFWFAGGGYDATDSKLIKAGERVFTEAAE